MRKIVIVLIIGILAILFVSCSASTVTINTDVSIEETTHENTNEHSTKIVPMNIHNTENPYFFPSGTTNVTYEYGEVMFWNSVEQSITLQVQKVGDINIDNAVLYELRLEYLKDLSDPYDQIPTERLHLGFFYVTEDKIYRFNSNYEIYRIQSLLYSSEVKIEDLLAESQIVCQEEAMPDVLGTEKGLHEVIEVDGDIRRFRSYNNLVETGFYERFVWKKGKGLIYYRSGYGAGREKIEFGYELESKKKEDD